MTNLKGKRIEKNIDSLLEDERVKSHIFIEKIISDSKKEDSFWGENIGEQQSGKRPKDEQNIDNQK
jgi:hypothetical protein